MKKETVKPAEATSTELLIKNEIIGIVLLFIAIFMLFSVISYSPADPSFFNHTPDHAIANFGGRSGAQVAALLINTFGFSAYVLLFYNLFMTSFFMFNKKINNIITKSAGYLLLLFSFAAFLANIKPYIEMDGAQVKSGGIVGYFLNEFLQSEIKQFFSALFFFILIVVSAVLIARLSLRRLAKFLIKLSVKLWEKIVAFANEQYAKFDKWRRIKRIQEKYQPAEPLFRGWGKKKTPDPQPQPEPVTITEPQFSEPFHETAKKNVVRKPSRIPEETASLFADFEDLVPTPGLYKPPPITYLDATTERSKIDYKELETKKEELGRRLSEFKIRGEIVEYTPGPVITTYEFVPDIGVKVKDVTNLSEDLALVARAQYVRIERILGKKAIGIEIPNKKREIIHLRDVLESEEYITSSSPLTIALGKTKSGEMFITDLREMPHLIVAGATGSGKSVAIHIILLSILYKASPDEVKLILIDPKRVEMALYSSLPHLLTPVVVDMKLAKNALDWAVYEMECRYKKLALFQVRNLEQFNKKLDLCNQNEDIETLDRLDGDHEKVPYIVIVIDEFADLMMEGSKEIENAVARIAQKARAVGIHLILATQRPSIDVITGTIKNNFPSRIALAVPSKHDSRTIIDVMGAEKLLGNGDMLFLPPKTATLIRLHCAYVSEDETLRVVNFLSKMGKPKFNTTVLKPKTDDDPELTDSELDQMFWEAAEITVNTGQASASYLQRKLSIGYARAGRLIDQLQAHGVVSQKDSKNKRDILMTTEDLTEMRKFK